MLGFVTLSLKRLAVSVSSEGPCPFCGSTDPRRRNGSCRQCDAPYDLHFGRQYTLERKRVGIHEWAIYRLRQFTSKGKAIDRSIDFGRFPFGQDGWARAWQAFLDLEPRYPWRRRWQRWKPRVGVATFWLVALGLLVASIIADGWIAMGLVALFVTYLITFLVLALGESLPWNE